MQKVDVESWEEFENELQQLQESRTALGEGGGSYSVSPFLFRGQRDHSWALTTTLERGVGNPWSLNRYFALVGRTLPQVETFTGSRWDIDRLEPPPEATHENFWLDFPHVWYEYLVYLRHHGFPSPLLDWSRSPYVAAYFAFSNLQASTDRVAVYAYLELAGYGKSTSSSEPRIETLGPYVRSHSRHFLQQCEYTLAAQFIDGRWMFASHGDVFAAGSKTQDQLWRITLPSKERLKVLRILESYNLNEFSLFQTDEALLRTIAVREMELSDRYTD